MRNEYYRDAVLINAWAVVSPRGQEKVIHDALAAKRLRGEWFFLDGADIGWLWELLEWEAHIATAFIEEATEAINAVG